MLTFLFAIAAIWTLFWLVMYMLDWGQASCSKTLCTVCVKDASNTNSNSSSSGNSSNQSSNAPTSKSRANAITASVKAGAGAGAGAQNNSQAGQKLGSNADTDAKAQAAASVQAAREEARAEAARTANAQVQKTAVKSLVADKHDQSNVTPLFVAPNEKDDLKEIKGIGVVMEKTLNDLGITTFKQLAGFEQAEVTMVTEALDASNSGFGDRINRDEWVDQAKALTRKAS